MPFRVIMWVSEYNYVEIRFARENQLWHRARGKFNKSIRAASKVRLQRIDISKTRRVIRKPCAACGVASNPVRYGESQNWKSRLSARLLRVGQLLRDNSTMLIIRVSHLTLHYVLQGRAKANAWWSHFYSHDKWTTGYRLEFLIKGRAGNLRTLDDSFSRFFSRDKHHQRTYNWNRNLFHFTLDSL